MFGMTKTRVSKIEMLPELAPLDIPDFEAELGEVLDAAAEGGELAGFEAGDVTAEPDAGAQTTAESKQSTTTRTNLAALAAFESEMRSAAASMDAMDTTMAAISAAHETASRFVGSLRAAVLRGNDLEEANAGLLAQNRQMSEQLEQTRHALSQRESAEEVSKRRIELLVKDFEETKIALGKAQIELVTLHDAISDTDAEKTALIYELATKSTAVDRLSRENELLRQKLVGQQMANADLEQRHAEAERKLDEVTALRKSEMVEATELRLRFDNTDKEYRRLQKQADHAQVRLTETQERVMTLESDFDELRDRHGIMAERFRSETETLRSKLETATRRNIADADEIAALKLQVGDAVSAASVAGAQLACANGQIDAWRASRSAVSPTGQVGGDINVIGAVSYSRDRPGKKAKKTLVDAGHVTKPGTRVARARKEHG